MIIKNRSNIKNMTELSGKLAKREYQVFIKPVGSGCNLRCHYCYYNELLINIGGTGAAVMDDSLLEAFTRQNIAAAGEGPVFFAWHGGEPTLAGVDFFRRAVEIQRKNNHAGVRILNGIQTNGTLINEEWCRFLAKENFAVGISLDGPEGLHNIHRVTSTDTGSFNKVVSAFKMLKDHGLKPEILCVVSAANAGHPLEVYRYFRSLGTEWITFLPLVVVDRTSSGAVTADSVQPEAFGKFLCAVFDEWVENDIGRIKVQIFEEAARVAFRQDHTICIFKKECGGVPVVERNGDFFSCDHYVNDENKIGNISKTPLHELLNCPRQIAFGNAKRDSLPAYCLDCEVLDMCNGECPKNRFTVTPDGESGLNYLCGGYRLFFNHVRPFVEAITQSL